MHFIGSSPAQQRLGGRCCAGIMGELGRRFGIEEEIPDAPEQLRLAFAHRAPHGGRARPRRARDRRPQPARGPRRRARISSGCRPSCPANVRLVLSTLPGRPLDELAKRGWPTLRVEPLTSRRAEDADRPIPGASTRRSSARRGWIASPPRRRPRTRSTCAPSSRSCASGACTRRSTSGSSTTSQRRRSTPSTSGSSRATRPTTSEDRPGLVRDAMSLIWAARRGLSEAELLDLLGADGEPLPAAYWSPLSLAAEQSLVSRSGLIGFFHDYVRRAVEGRYLPRAIRARGRPPAPRRLLRRSQAGAEGDRRAPLAARRGGRLAAPVRPARRPRVLRARLGTRASSRSRPHWAEVEANSPLRLVDAYRPVLDDARDAPTRAAFRSLQAADRHRPSAGGARAAGALRRISAGLGATAANLQASLGEPGRDRPGPGRARRGDGPASRRRSGSAASAGDLRGAPPSRSGTRRRSCSSAASSTRRWPCSRSRSGSAARSATATGSRARSATRP